MEFDHRDAAHTDPAAVAQWIPALVASGLLIAFYAILLYRRQRLIPRPWSRWRVASWIIGSAFIGLGLSPLVHGSGADDHMYQHLLLSMYGPVFLILAAPVTVLLGGAARRWRTGVGKVLGSGPVAVISHPVTASILHIGHLFLLYLTGLYELTMTQAMWHWVLIIHFVGAGCLYAWAIAGSDPAPHRPGLIARAAVLVVSAGLHAWLAKLLYAGSGELPAAALHPPHEIEHAAKLMYYAGDGAELILAVALFSSWYTRRKRSLLRRESLSSS